LLATRLRRLLQDDAGDSPRKLGERGLGLRMLIMVSSL
jgi:hypothetical protein